MVFPKIETMASQGIAMWFHSSTATEEAELQKSGANGFYLTLNDPSRNTSIDFYAKIWNVTFAFPTLDI
jgi:hypothetical protein